MQNCFSKELTNKVSAERNVNVIIESDVHYQIMKDKSRRYAIQKEVHTSHYFAVHHVSVRFWTHLTLLGSSTSIKR